MLHELIDYAAREGIKSEPGFKPKRVRWLLVFDTNGKFLDVIEFESPKGKPKGREFPTCPDLSQGEMISAGCRHFLVDSLDKTILLTKETPNEKDIANHESYVGLLTKAVEAIASLASIAAALADDETLEMIRNQLTEKKAKPTDSSTIAVTDGGLPNVFVEHSDWHAWWRAHRSSLGSGGSGSDASKKPAKKKMPAIMRCFLSGELVEPAATQNKVTGLSDVGGLPTGDVLSSFDKDSFGHYGFSKGENAAISTNMVKLVTDSLNHLIQHRSHRLCGTKILYWYSHSVAPEEDVLADLFGDESAQESDEGTTRQELLSEESKAHRLLTAIRSGKRPDLMECQFFALTLSGNSGRVIIRDWLQGPLVDIATNVEAWFDDLSIISRDGKSSVNHFKFLAVLGAMVRDLSDMPSPTVATMWRCALQRQPIPAPFAAQVLARVRIDVIQDQAARHARLGFLRASLIRNPPYEGFTMTTDVDDSIDSPAYLCGRIMALLANIQEKALGKVGAGVVQRYYAAASATPALVLGRLVRTAQVAHLPKIDGGLRHHFEGQLANLWDRMKTAPPTTLSLEEQTLFAMGFYQQQASRFKKAEPKETAEPSES